MALRLQPLNKFHQENDKISQFNIVLLFFVSLLCPDAIALVLLEGQLVDSRKVINLALHLLNLFQKVFISEVETFNLLPKLGNFLGLFKQFISKLWNYFGRVHIYQVQLWVLDWHQRYRLATLRKLQGWQGFLVVAVMWPQGGKEHNFAWAAKTVLKNPRQFAWSIRDELLWCILFRNRC